jgi:hypothetical protein
MQQLLKAIVVPYFFGDFVQILTRTRRRQRMEDLQLYCTVPWMIPGTLVENLLESGLRIATRNPRNP